MAKRLSILDSALPRSGKSNKQEEHLEAGGILLPAFFSLSGMPGGASADKIPSRRNQKSSFPVAVWGGYLDEDDTLHGPFAFVLEEPISNIGDWWMIHD
ncbi:MAG: hypothetical protein JJU11_13440 [Candidatus Sumerlaeia bacterium]|nr:hypothetical protein [Candidatus Sumerlaeia bacterium]